MQILAIGAVVLLLLIVVPLSARLLARVWYDEKQRHLLKLMKMSESKKENVDE